MKQEITLANLHEKTEQEVFDYVAKHLLTQKKRSKGKTTCRYKMGDLKCAAGCLMAEDEYKETMEGAGWVELVTHEDVPGAHKELIHELQAVHDCDHPKYWKEELSKLAKRRCLTFNF